MARRKTHPGSIDRRGGSYRLRLCVGGQNFSYSLPGMSKKDVETFAKLRERSTTYARPEHPNVLPEVPEAATDVLRGPPQGPEAA